MDVTQQAARLVSLVSAICANEPDPVQALAKIQSTVALDSMFTLSVLPDHETQSASTFISYDKRFLSPELIEVVQHGLTQFSNEYHAQGESLATSH